MWLYIPSSYAPESECSEKASELHSAILESSIEPSVTWSGKPVQRAKLSRLWKQERLIRRLSGLTLSRSMAQHGADAWIASLPGSLAKTSPLLEGEQVSTVSVPASSSTLSTSPMLAVRGSSFWRTCQTSLLPPPPLWTKPKTSSKSARPPESWENWPTAGGMRSGRIYARPTSVQITNESAGSASRGAWLTPHGMSGIEAETGKVGAGGEFAKQVHQWMTPTTMAAKGVEYQRQADGTNLAILSGQAQQWATPNVPNGGRSVSAEVVASRGKTENGKRQVGLESEVRHWATPQAHDSVNGKTPEQVVAMRARGHGVSNLNEMASSWATPTARGHKDGATSLDNVEVNGLLGRQVLATSLHPVHSTLDGRELSPTDRTLRRRLNPAFACWLMGWPIWWTNPAITNSVKLETELWRSKLALQLSHLLGEPESFKDTTKQEPEVNQLLEEV